VCMPWLLRIMGCPNSAHFDGTLVPGEEPSTASIAEVTDKADGCQSRGSQVTRTGIGLCESVHGRTLLNVTRTEG
jgi:hypothetical protein